jgi:hypothetical protein
MHSFVHEIDTVKKHSFKFSICTLVTNQEEYNEMVDSFKKAGFDEKFCEYIFIDNSKKNKYDAYKGINRFLSLAQGEYIIICHQDVLLNFDKIEKLEKCIEEMNQKDLNWGLLGNAGGMHYKRNASKIANGAGKIHEEGPLPAQVSSLDENFILVKKEANLSLSHDLSGFHLYGADMCLIARVIGYKAYVIDFLLTHKSYGNADRSFYDLRTLFIKKYKTAFQGIFIQTTITKFFISGSSLKSSVYNTKLVQKLVNLYWKVTK